MTAERTDGGRMSAERRDAPALSLRKRAIFALLPTLVMAVASEFVLRAALPDVEIRTSLSHGGFLRPYRPLAEADLVSADFRVRYRINEWGFRDRRGRALEPASTGRRIPRVVAFGDSFTEGYGVEQHETYTRRLEATGDFEVLGLARMGASPMFYIVMAREFVPKLRPDVVLVQLFDNDLDENRYRHLPREADGRVGVLPDALRPGAGLAARARDAWTALAWVQGFDRLRQRLRGKTVARLFVRPGSRVEMDAPVAGDAPGGRLFPWYDPENAEEWGARFAEQEVLLRQLVAELRATGVPLVLAYVPHHPEIVAGNVAASQAANPHDRLLARLSKELLVPLVDGVAVFGAPGRDPTAYYHANDQHWNAAGHALFASAVEAQLRAELSRVAAP
jgi:lysophospholipase L1-like esterase